MNIYNWGVAMPDIDFGREHRTLAPDLKKLLQNLYIGKKHNRKKLDATLGNRTAYLVQSSVFDYVFSI